MRSLPNSKSLILIAFIFCFISSAYADNVAKATQDIPKETFAKIASDCKKKYEDLLDSGITAKMREGAVNHGDCLLESIEKYADGFFDKQQKKILFDQIKSARQTYFSINDIIAQNNEHFFSADSQQTKTNSVSLKELIKAIRDLILEFGSKSNK